MAKTVVCCESSGGLSVGHQAIEDYTAAIQRESRNFRAIYNRGNCFRKVGVYQCFRDSFVDYRYSIEPAANVIPLLISACIEPAAVNVRTEAGVE